MNSFPPSVSSENWKKSRLTCEWKPEEEDNSFSFDHLIVDELEMPSLDCSRELFCDANDFNVLYGTHYTQENLEKFINYQDHYGLLTNHAIDYVQSCHCCNEQLHTFAGEYCSGGCHNHVEELGLPCFRGASCLICNRESLDQLIVVDFLEQQCDDCSSEFTYPPFEYYYDDEIHNVDSIHYVCNACFCRNSNYSLRHFNTYPVMDHPCHNPLVSSIYCCNELQLYNQIDDLRVWSDLYQYMY